MTIAGPKGGNVKLRLILTIGAVFAFAAPAALAAPAEGTSPEISALMARGQALNQQYHLGGPATVDRSAAIHAFVTREENLNQQSLGGGPSRVQRSEAIHALQLRGEALNRQYGLGTYASTHLGSSSTDSSGQSWVLGAGMGAFLLLLSAGGAVYVRRSSRNMGTTG